MALLSRELFGVPLALPYFPELKGVRGIGMSDPPNLAPRMAEKFDYTNTFYHQAPVLDITNPPEQDLGRYDFILSSEVMEHVPPPVEASFLNLYRLLKPDGLLLMTVPYSMEAKTREHFPELNEYALASPGGRTVLVNRRRDGTMEVFENLCFHGGDGSTLEMRVFTEESLLAVLRGAGFTDVRVAAENVPEFGVEHAETWSLPIVARKGSFRPPAAEIAQAYGAAAKRAAHVERELNSIRGEYEKHIAFHKQSHQEMQRLLAEREQWVRKVETDFEERSQWAFSLEREKNEAIGHFERVQKEAQEAWARIQSLERELAELRSGLSGLQGRLWTRLGRKVGALK